MKQFTQAAHAARWLVKPMVQEIKLRQAGIFMLPVEKMAENSTPVFCQGFGSNQERAEAKIKAFLQFYHAFQDKAAYDKKSILAV